MKHLSWEMEVGHARLLQSPGDYPAHESFSKLLYKNITVTLFLLSHISSAIHFVKLLHLCS